MNFFRRARAGGALRRAFGSLLKLRNIGISAHIDSGKTTFSERVLFYSGRIDRIHEVKGSDGVGATMDFMELEREKGITIQSAATSLSWKGYDVNLIDTPGHVDFTIEVERALRVLDGAVLLLCGVAGVQAQTYTVYKQMERYGVPRIIFINKLDRLGASPAQVRDNIQKKLGLSAELVQIPIGEDEQFRGVVDLVRQRAFFFEGESGREVVEREVPPELRAQADAARQTLLERVCELDDALAEKYLMNEPIGAEELRASIRALTLARRLAPIFVGSAYKNKGVQLALDGVIDYLPAPDEKQNSAYESTLNAETKKSEERPVVLSSDPAAPFVALAFKLEENRYGQLTFCRVYQGRLRKGESITNVREGKRVKVTRMVKMHANKIEDIAEAASGDIFALFGVECSSGTTFTKDERPGTSTNLYSMYVPDPVISVSLKCRDKKQNEKLQKALRKFHREDPTFSYNVDNESEELVISGMGELHLQIYAERLRREFEIEVQIGAPTVNYREMIAANAKFNYLHKKQTGGAGQFARVVGHFEPISALDARDRGRDIFVNQFVSKLVGQNVPSEYVVAVEKQFYDSCNKGPLTGYPIINTRMVLLDGETHVVDSSSNAFALATKYALTQAFAKSGILLEPIMDVEVSVPKDHYQPVMNSVTKRRGVLYSTDVQGEFFAFKARVPLSAMFGFSSELRGFTQGQGEFSMEYLTHEPVSPEEIPAIVKRVRQARRELNDN